MGRQIEGQSSGRWKSSGLLLMFLGRIKVQEEVSSHTHTRARCQPGIGVSEGPCKHPRPRADSPSAAVSDLVTRATPRTPATASQRRTVDPKCHLAKCGRAHSHWMPSAAKHILLTPFY